LEYYTPQEGVKKVLKDNDLRSLLKNIYAYDGFLAGDWIKSIDLLRTHPRL